MRKHTMVLSYHGTYLILWVMANVRVLACTGASSKPSWFFRSGSFGQCQAAATAANGCIQQEPEPEPEPTAAPEPASTRHRPVGSLKRQA
jgi:hypothetical protein